MGYKNHRDFLLFIVFLITGVICFDILAVSYIEEHAPPYEAPSVAYLSICTFSETFCRGASYDPFALAITLWATLQLTWTSVLALSHLWQITRQMTTFEVSNLGRFGFMGGRGGTSLRDQSGAVGNTVFRPMPETGADGEMVDLSTLPPPPGGAGGHHGHHHHHGGAIGRICCGLKNAVTGPLFKLLGFDRFTEGKAVSGMARAGRDQNPFDLGLVKVSSVMVSYLQLELHRLLVQLGSGRLRSSVRPANGG